MGSIEITDHAYVRMKERMGLNRKAADRLVPVAFTNGIQHSDTKGSLFRYISDKSRAYMRKGSCFKIYGETVFCFLNCTKQNTGEGKIVLLTVWVIPHNYKNQVLSLQRRKKIGATK